LSPGTPLDSVLVWRGRHGTWGLYGWHVAAIVASDAAGRSGGLHLGDSIAGALPRLSPGTPLDIAVV